MTSFEVTEPFERDLIRNLGILEVSSLGAWATLDFEEVSLGDELSELVTPIHSLQIGVGSIRFNYKNNK